VVLSGFVGPRLFGRASQSLDLGVKFIPVSVGLDDRDEARLLSGYEICISRSLLPNLTGDEYYWYQLQGLSVINQDEQLFGKVDHLLETGANDVLVVKPCAGSLDDRERLLPYTEQCVLAIDLDAGVMRVEWDADF
jgi:16S rRNA processing protein RimM